MNSNGSSSYKFTIDHSSKTAVFYGSHSMLAGLKAELSGAEEGTSVTVINPANGSKLTMLMPNVNAVNFKISKEGETDVIYKGYFIPDGHGFYSASYSVSATTAIKDITMKKGTTAYTSDNTQVNISPDATAKASHLQLNGFLGEITSASPESAVTVSEDKRSATVNWYQANGTISLTLKWTQNEEAKETTISITDRRVSNLNYTAQQPHGQIGPSYGKLYSGDPIIWTAYPEEGYKLDKFTVTGAEGQSVNYTMDATDPNKMSLPIPYDEFSVSASFVPLKEGDKSSVALLKSFTIGGRTVTPDSNHNVVIEGVPKSTDLSTLTPTFVLSNGASVDDADTLMFEPNVKKTITVRAENGINTSSYYITIKQMQLEGEGTEQSPFLIASVDDFKKFMQTPVAAVFKQTVDLDLTGVTGTAGSLISSFSGTYDGDGHKISNLSLSSNSNAALFGNLTGTVRNVTMDQTCSFSGTERVASVAVFLSENGKIEGCKNYATITCTPATVDESTNMYVGGIVAETTQNGTAQINHLKDCENHGTLTIAGDIANSGRVGGIAGSINGCFVQNCQNYVDITSGKSSEGYYGSTGNIAGGIAGQAAGNNTLVGCGNSGNISAGGYVGGIVGLAKNTRNSSLLIESCFNTGEISAYNISCDQNAGGIAGSAFGDIRNCYNTGKISGSTTGGNANRASILGYANVETGSNGVDIYHCYAIEADGVSIGGQDDSITVSNNTTLMTAEQMKSQDFVDTLNSYTNPKSHVGVTFTVSSDSENNGHPSIGTSNKVPNYEAAITSFMLAGRYGVIDEAAHTITVQLPNGVTVTSLTPTIIVSEGAAVDKTDAQDFTNPVKYTVTSEDGKNSTEYTVTVSIASEATGLSYFAAKHDGTALSVTSGDNGKKIITVTDAELAKGASALTIEYLTNSGEKATAALGDADLTQGTSGTYDSLVWRYNVATLTSGTKALTMHYGSESQGVEIVIRPTLKNISVKVDDVAQKLVKTEDGYRLDLPNSATNVTVTAEAVFESDSIAINGATGSSAVVDVTSLTSFNIAIGSSNIPVTINRVKTTSVTFMTDPANAAVTLLDQDGKAILPDENGVYSLVSGDGYSYTYRVMCNGYITKEGTLNSQKLSGDTLILDISLSKVSSGGNVTPVDPVTGDWTSFRGNGDNNGVTHAKTPHSEDESTSWAVSTGLLTPPLLVDGKLYIQTGRTVKTVNPKNGDIIKTSEQLAGTSQFATNPLAYGENMIFVLLDDNDNARVQALDATTLESLWISETLQGQNISPITYHNGYLYTGTWNAETKEGTYYCLSVTDEDSTRTDEVKKTIWTINHAGGFYWVGAYATDDYVIFGSDNGKSGYTETGSTLYSVNPTNGRIIDTMTSADGLIGDLRSAIVHSGDYVFFTSKAGYLYRVNVDSDGNLSNLQSFKTDGMCTGSPTVYGDVVFVTCSGEDQFNDPGKLYAVDAATMQKIEETVTPGYVQSSLLISDAYKAEENALYLYATYNKTPGGLYLVKYDLTQKTLTGDDLFVPEGSQAQYNICSPICDAKGTIYFKNDSGYLFGIAREIIETDVTKVEQMIENLFPITDDSLDAIKQARRYYEALGDKKSEVSNADLLDQAEREYQQRLTEKRQNALEQLKAVYDAKDTKDFTANGLKKLKEAYEEGVRNINKAEDCNTVESSLNAAIEKINKLNGKDITVTFRLIGALEATQDVNLTNDSYLPEYVTWIPTTTYSLDAGAKVYDVFMEALKDAGLSQIGADNNYVKTIYAPSCLGGYALSEFTNGNRSGWMYTVNGSHPNQGLKSWELKDGDVVVWHYVNDYAHEVADWFNDSQYPSLGDGSYYNSWLRARDITPEQYVNELLGKILMVGKNGTVEPKLTLSHLGKSVTFTFKPDKGYRVKDVKVDGKSVGAVTSYTVNELTVSTRIEVEFTNGTLPFTDVLESDWFYDDVVFAYENGLFSGTSDTTFSPNASMTRAMLVTVLYRLEGQPAVSGRSGFSDVQYNGYYEDAVTWAADNGIVNGTSTSTFSPNANVTREQMAAILYRYAQYKKYNTAASSSLTGFNDYATVSSYAVTSLQWSVAEKLVNGSNGKLMPTGNATRAQVAAILHRFVENVAKTTN